MAKDQLQRSADAQHVDRPSEETPANYPLPAQRPTVEPEDVVKMRDGQPTDPITETVEKDALPDK